jgi:hypothetical protein
MKGKIFNDLDGIIKARFRVSHRRPGRKDIRYGNTNTLGVKVEEMLHERVREQGMFATRFSEKQWVWNGVYSAL